MTIQELINQLQNAIDQGFSPDTKICAETDWNVNEEQTYWGIYLDTDSSGYSDKNSWKIAINVYDDTWEEDTDSTAAESVATSRKCVPIANIKQILAEQTVSTALLGPHGEELREMLEDSMRDHSKQEDTNTPAAEQMLTRENLEKYGWTVVPQGAWFGVDYDQSYKVDVLALLTDLLDLDVDSVDGYDFVVCGYKKIIHQDEEEEEEEDTDSTAAEEECAFDWTRKGCIDCDD